MIEEQKVDSGFVKPDLWQTPCCAKPFWERCDIQIWNENCLHTLKRLGNNSIDLTVTSPPYDKLRTYKGFTFPFKHIARHLYRVTKDGGVVVWVVNDATVNGTETGTSFQQALFFKECGFLLYDTMIWKKTGMLPTEGRYYNQFEYMFILSKGKPKTINFICDHKTVNGGRKQRKDAVINKGENIKGDGFFIRNEFARRPNVWEIHIGKSEVKHPAQFPEKLAQDHIFTWSNEGDTVYDPFGGSGTTSKMALLMKRKSIMSEMSNDYCELSAGRLSKHLPSGLFV
jgi:DNA modification methylase